MSNGNSVTLVGNVTRDPEPRFTPNGQATASSDWPSIAGGRTARPRSGRKQPLSSMSCAGERWQRT